MRKSFPMLIAVSLLCAAGLPAQAAPQDGFELSQLMGGAQDVIARAPDGQVDELFQALHGAMRSPQEAEAICSLFDDGADRGIDGLNGVATRLGPDSQQRFANAIANVLVAGLQGRPQDYDRDAAAQALKSNGARAAILHDGFSAGLAAQAPRAARCTTLGQMLDVLAQRPQGERVQVTRLLLEQGLRQAR